MQQTLVVSGLGPFISHVFDCQIYYFTIADSGFFITFFITFLLFFFVKIPHSARVLVSVDCFWLCFGMTRVSSWSDRSFLSIGSWEVKLSPRLYLRVYESSEGFYGSTYMRRLVLAFPVNIKSGPLSGRQQIAIQMIFLWRADSGPSL